jgi:PKD repeat protein
MGAIDYIYDINYDVLETINVPFSSVNLGGLNTNTTFDGEIGRLSFNIDFNKADPVISDIGYFIDFGDGTVSRDLTASHIYKVPGDYLVTLVVTDSANNLFKSDGSRIINVKNVIPDTIVLTYSDVSTQFRSAPSANFIVTRYNGIETSRILSANDYSINLSVSGNTSNFLTEKDYNNTKNIQLSRNTFFMDSIGNNFKVIDSLKTSTSDIYAKLTDNGLDLVFSGTKQEDNFYVGTSGFGNFFYYED